MAVGGSRVEEVEVGARRGALVAYKGGVGTARVRVLRLDGTGSDGIWTDG